MTTPSPIGPLLHYLEELEDLCRHKDPSLREIFNIFGADGHYMIVLFLILPFLQPIPLIGLSTPFGLLIAAVAGLAYLRKPPWLPVRWQDKTLPGKTVLKIAEGSEKIFQKLAFMIHPRMKFLFKGPFRTLNNLLLIINAILLALPLPIPFSNAIPSWMIFFLTLGELEEDGVLILVSYAISLGSFLFFGAIYKGAAAGLGVLGL